MGIFGAKKKTKISVLEDNIEIIVSEMLRQTHNDGWENFKNGFEQTSAHGAKLLDLPQNMCELTALIMSILIFIVKNNTSDNKLTVAFAGLLGEKLAEKTSFSDVDYQERWIIYTGIMMQYGDYRDFAAQQLLKFFITTEDTKDELESFLNAWKPVEGTMTSIFSSYLMSFCLDTIHFHEKLVSMLKEAK